MDGPVIEIKDVAFAYNGHPVLDQVNLTVRQGDFMAIIGPNGGGKSTLVKLILGLLKPGRGAISVFGHPPNRVTDTVGYVPQDFGLKNTMPVTVLDVVLMGRMSGWGGFRRFSHRDRTEALSILESVGMKDYPRAGMGQLSGGQRQRVLLARALVSKPELLVLDEPLSNIDTQGQSDFYAYLKKLNRTTTIVLVSHDLMVLSSYVKTVACVNRQVHFHDRPEITGDMLKAAYHCPVELIAHGLPHRVLPEHKVVDDD